VFYVWNGMGWWKVGHGLVIRSKASGIFMGFFESFYLISYLNFSFVNILMDAPDFLY
jgi:hypothetical protein